MLLRKRNVLEVGETDYLDVDDSAKQTDTLCHNELDRFKPCDNKWCTEQTEGGILTKRVLLDYPLHPPTSTSPVHHHTDVSTADGTNQAHTWSTISLTNFL